ncbi:MAG: hypothetical protein ACO3RE_07000, partial [Ilumatobacteraceae bacterium]
TANSESRRLRLETEDFLDQRLASFEILLERLSKTVATGRQKLSIVGIQEPAENPSTGDPDVAEAEARAGFFDQDR